MAKITLKWLLKMWLQQVVLLLVAVASFWWIHPVIAYSILIGGLIYSLPNLYFSVYAFRFRGAPNIQRVLLGFYRGEVGKFLLSAVAFAVVFTLITPLNIIAVFISYIALTMIQWLQVAIVTR